MRSVASEFEHIAHVDAASDHPPSHATSVRFSRLRNLEFLTLRLTLPSTAKVFISQLTPNQHLLLQHGAATLLLREPESLVHKVLGGFHHLVKLLEHTNTPPPENHTGKLFGVSLKSLNVDESTDSHHGLGKHTIRVPTFVSVLVRPSSTSTAS